MNRTQSFKNIIKIMTKNNLAIKKRNIKKIEDKKIKNESKTRYLITNRYLMKMNYLMKIFTIKTFMIQSSLTTN